MVDSFWSYIEYAGIVCSTAHTVNTISLIRRLNAGQDVDIAAMLKMVNRLFKQ